MSRTFTPLCTSDGKHRATDVNSLAETGYVTYLTRQAGQDARLTAETTARRDAVVIEVAMPTPHTTLSPIAHST